MVITYSIFYFLLAGFILMFGYAGVKKGKSFYGKHKKMDEIYDKYENLRNCRRELVQHYFWAEDLKEYSRMPGMEVNIENMDKELDELRTQYFQLKKTGIIGLKSL